MLHTNKPTQITALAAAFALSGCAATGGFDSGGSAGGGTGSSSTEPQVFPAYFATVTPTGNYDVNNPRLAEGKPDGQYAVVEPHGALTLDIGHNLTYYDGQGNDLFVRTHQEREANYTIHVQHAGRGNDQWTEVDRGYGSGEYNLKSHQADYADFVQFRNEGTQPLYIDAVKARYVRRD